MHTEKAQADLFLNGEPVGLVVAQGFSDSWGYGQFIPNDAFARYAPLFGMWGMLLHEDDDTDRASREALMELSRIETAIDAMRAELHWIEPAEWTPISQINIDGTLIEWKRQ